MVYQFLRVDCTHLPNAVFRNQVFPFFVFYAIALASFILAFWSNCAQWFHVCGRVAARYEPHLCSCRRLCGYLPVQPMHSLSHRMQGLAWDTPDWPGWFKWFLRLNKVNRSARWVYELFRYPIVLADALLPLTFFACMTMKIVVLRYFSITCCLITGVDEALWVFVYSEKFKNLCLFVSHGSSELYCVLPQWNEARSLLLRCHFW